VQSRNGAAWSPNGAGRSRKDAACSRSGAASSPNRAAWSPNGAWCSPNGARRSRSCAARSGSLARMEGNSLRFPGRRMSEQGRNGYWQGKAGLYPGGAHLLNGMARQSHGGVGCPWALTLPLAGISRKHHQGPKWASPGLSPVSFTGYPHRREATGQCMGRLAPAPKAGARYCPGRSLPGMQAAHCFSIDCAVLCLRGLYWSKSVDWNTIAIGGWPIRMRLPE
jgi:hypothetical protein